MCREGRYRRHFRWEGWILLWRFYQGSCQSRSRTFARHSLLPLVWGVEGGALGGFRRRNRGQGVALMLAFTYHESRIILVRIEIFILLHLPGAKHKESAGSASVDSRLSGGADTS